MLKRILISLFLYSVVTCQDSNVKGPPGVQGEKGATGDPGENGADGADGKDGYCDVEGSCLEMEWGPEGAEGDLGPQGQKGDTGETGENGAPGIPGVTGEAGDQGATGDMGKVGPKGDTGAPGVNGDTPRGPCTDEECRGPKLAECDVVFSVHKYWKCEKDMVITGFVEPLGAKKQVGVRCCKLNSDRPSTPPPEPTVPVPEANIDPTTPEVNYEPTEDPKFGK